MSPDGVRKPRSSSIKNGRAALGLGVRDLPRRAAQVSTDTVSRLRAWRGIEGERTVDDIRRALEDAGAEFP